MPAQAERALSASRLQAAGVAVPTATAASAIESSLSSSFSDVRLSSTPIPMVRSLPIMPALCALTLWAAQPRFGTSPAAEGLFASSVPSGSLSLSFDAPSSARPGSAPPSDAVSWTRIEQLESAHQYKIHKDSVTGLCVSSDGETVFSVSQDASLKIYSLADKRQVRSINVGELALSSCALSNDGKAIAVGSWDNSVYIYSIDYGRILDTVTGHDDAVSAIRLRDNMLATASWDATIKIWDCPISSGDLRKSTRSFEIAEHEAEVKCLDVSHDHALIASGGMDGAAAPFISPSFCLCWRVRAHNDRRGFCFFFFSCFFCVFLSQGRSRCSTRKSGTVCLPFRRTAMP